MPWPAKPESLERGPEAVSQKTITGHAKGGAAVFQVAGLTEILASGVAPGNASLDVVDAPLAKDAFWVWPRRPIRLAGRGGQDGRVPGAARCEPAC